MNHAMIDLETLGNSTVAAIATCAVVIFNPINPDPEAMPIKSLHLLIDLDSCVDIGLRIDHSTLEFWLNQDTALLKETFLAQPRLHIAHAMQSLRYFLENNPVSIVWSFGTTFDISLINEACRRLTVQEPWSYRQIRDARTLFDLVYQMRHIKVKDIHRSTTAHNALSDCIAQARGVQASCRLLNISQFEV